MIFDAQSLFSDGQAVTASAASTNIIDLGSMGIPFGSIEAPVRDIGKGCKIPLLVQVIEDFATCTSVTVTVQTSDTTDFSSSTTHSTSVAVPLASLVAGYQFFPDTIPVADIAGMGRYMRLYYTVAGSDATAGEITAGIVGGIQTNV